MAWDPFDEYFSDPEFRKLAGPDKISVLSQVDPEFAQLPIKEQANVVQAYLNTPPAGKGVLETLGSAIAGTGHALLHPIVALHAAAASQEELRQKAGEAARTGHPAESFGYRLAAGMPAWIGPMAAQAGEDIGTGKTAQGITEAGLLLLPFAGAESLRALPPAGRFIRGAAKAAPAAAATAAKTMPVWATELVPGMPHWIPPAITAGAAAPELIRGGLAEMRGEVYPPVPPPSWSAPPVTFRSQPAPVGAPPVTFPTPAAGPSPKPAPPVTFPSVGETPEPTLVTKPAPPVWTRERPAPRSASTPAKPTATAPTPAPAAAAPPTSPAAPAAQGGIPPIEVPFGQPVVTPPETLPSADWRFEDARDMARLLNQHGLNPADMEEGEWRIAAPALKRNLGVPNARSAQLVHQEWLKLQPRGQ